MAPRWTPQEDALLKKIYPHSRKADILNQIDKPWLTVCRRARRLNLYRDKHLIDEDRKVRGPRKDRLKPEEEAALREVYETGTKKEIEERMAPWGRSWQSIFRFAKLLGLERDRGIIIKEILDGSQKGADTIKWPDDEMETLKKIYEHGTKKDIMAALPGRTWKAIREQAVRTGLRRDEDIINEERNQANRATSRERYGVEWATQIRSMKDKSRQTNLERRGVEFPSQSPEVRRKVAESVHKKYGVGNVFQSEEIKEKSRQSNLERHGAENPMQSPEIRRRAFETTKEHGLLPISNKELDFYEHLKRIDPTVEHQVFHPTANHVIDFYLPRHDLWVQFDGDYWHGRNFIESDIATPQGKNIKKKMENDTHQNKAIPNLIRFWESDVDQALRDGVIDEYIKSAIEAKEPGSSFPCFQHRKKEALRAEDLKRIEFDPSELKASDFTLNKETLSKEIVLFTKRYEWLGNVGNTPRWCFTARHKGLLAGVVLINEPNSYSSLMGEKTSSYEALIQRGATASWTPKNLGSRLIMFACKWMVSNTGKRLFTGYADPRAQEIGTIYQACNFDYLGDTFGTRSLYRNPCINDGRPFSSQSLKRTSSFRRWCKNNNIEILPSWFKENGYKNLAAMPPDVRTRWEQWTKKVIRESEKIPVETKHKYVKVLGRNRREQRMLDGLKTYKAKPYPKRSPDSAPYCTLPPCRTRRKRIMPSRVTPEKTSFIKQNYANMTQQEIADALGETKRWVSSQVKKLVKNGELQTKHGIGSTKSRKNPEKVAFVSENYGKMTRQEIADALGENVRWVKRQISLLRKDLLK